MASFDSDHTRRATEGITDFDWPGAYYGTAPDFAGDYWSGFYGNAFLYPPYFLDSQKRGEALPFYITERQLKIIRDRSRRLVAENEFAVSAVENRISYIVGSGFNYRILPLHEDIDDALVTKTQRLVDIFVEANRLNELEQEMVRRVDRDGEAFVRMFFHDSGLLQLRWVEPEHVRSPDGDSDPQRSFGIETDPRDIESLRGYWIIESPLTNPTPTLVKASKIKHVKMNLDSSAKRGLPLLYPVESNLRRAEELLAALTMTTKTRAKIAMIRRVEGATKTAAEKLKADLESGATTGQTVFDPITGGATNVEQFRMGSILTSSKNIEYELPDIGSNQAGIEILKAELRAVASRLVMPEPMLTADASGGSYSSFLVNEAPPTTKIQRHQTFYRGVFGESRAPQRESLVWRQIAWAVECGLLDRDVLTKVRVIAKAPAIVPRDPDKAAAAIKVYYDMGVKSPQGIADELGENYDEVQRERQDAGLPDISQMNAALGGAGGGMPGDVGVNAPNSPQGTPGQSEGDDEGPGNVNDKGDFEFDSSVFED